MNTLLTFKVTTLTSITLLLNACVTGNMVSTTNFEFHVSDIKFDEYNCTQLNTFERSFLNSDFDSYQLARKISGIELYPETLAPDVEQMILQANLRSVSKSMKKNNCL